MIRRRRVSFSSGLIGFIPEILWSCNSVDIGFELIQTGVQ